MSAATRNLSPQDVFNRAQYLDTTPLNRYAATPLDRAYHESAQWWGRVAQIVSLVALLILGTAASVYCHLNDSPLAGTLCVIITASAGVNIYQWCDQWIAKQIRYAETATIFHQITEENPQNSEPIRRLQAHQQYYLRAFQNEEVHSQEQIDQAAQPVVMNGDLSYFEKAARIREIYRSAAEAAVYKLRAAYFAMLIQDASDTRELLSACVIRPWDFESYAAAILISQHMPAFNVFVEFSSDQSTLTMLQVLNTPLIDLAARMRLPSQE